MLTELKIKNSQRRVIQKLQTKGLKQEMVTEVDADGQKRTKNRFINPEVLEDNVFLVKDALVKAVYSITDKEIEEMDVEDYDAKLNEILDYATENQIGWIIDLKLCKKHAELSENQTKKKD